MRRLPFQSAGQAEGFHLVSSDPEEGYQRPQGTVYVDTNNQLHGFGRIEEVSCNKLNQIQLISS